MKKNTVLPLLLAAAFALVATGCVFIGGDGKPSAPTGVTTEPLSYSSIRVSWNVVPEASSYKIYYAIGGSYTKHYVGTTYGAFFGSSFIHAGLSRYTNYWYYITAVNSYGESVYSLYDDATTLN